MRADIVLVTILINKTAMSPPAVESLGRIVAGWFEDDRLASGAALAAASSAGTWWARL